MNFDNKYIFPGEQTNRLGNALLLHWSNLRLCLYLSINCLEQHSCEVSLVSYLWKLISAREWKI